METFVLKVKFQVLKEKTRRRRKFWGFQVQNRLKTSLKSLFPTVSSVWKRIFFRLRRAVHSKPHFNTKNDFSQLSDPRENTWDAASMRVAMSCYTRPTPATRTYRALSGGAQGPTGRPEYIKNNYRNQNPHKKNSQKFFKDCSACSRES